MSNRRFVRYSWFFIGYLLFVILFGAWVRISGSGNGCGSHWPTCHGAIVPAEPQLKTIIEFSHRVTSGLSGFLAIALVIWARRIGPAIFRASLATLFFLIIEALIGAVLVKRELVADNASADRAVAVGVHLANTLILMACATLTARWASSPDIIKGALSRPLILLCLAALIVTNMTGAVTALGDTLFPKQPALDGSLLATIQQDVTAGEHFLVRLRIVHPVIAVCAAMFVGALLHLVPRGKLTRIAIWILAAQLVAGVVNILLAAPAWMQIVHLLLAQVLWVAVVAVVEPHLFRRAVQ